MSGHDTDDPVVVPDEGSSDALGISWLKSRLAEMNGEVLAQLEAEGEKTLVETVQWLIEHLDEDALRALYNTAWVDWEANESVLPFEAFDLITDLLVVELAVASSDGVEGEDDDDTELVDWLDLDDEDGRWTGEDGAIVA